MTQDKIVGLSRKILKGEKLSKIERLEMSRMGIDDAMADRVVRMMDEFGEGHETLSLPNVDNWTDLEAKRVFKAAIIKQADLTINTPGVGSSPIWVSTDIGRLIGQFKSFAFASHQQTLIAGTQRLAAGDMNFALGFGAAIVLGATATNLKMLAAGKPMITDERSLIVKGIDQSGYLTMLGEINNISDKLAGVSIDQAIGGQPARPYNYYGDSLGAMLGPTYTSLESVVDTARSGLHTALGNSEWRASDTRSVRRMLWFQNHILLRNLLFNNAEEAFNEEIGVR